MEKKNVYMFAILATLFIIDFLMHTYINPPEVVIRQPQVSNSDNKEGVDLSTITEDDLKLEEDKTLNNNNNLDKNLDNNLENNESHLINNSKSIKITVKHCNSKTNSYEAFKKEMQGSLANVEIDASIYPPSSTNVILSKVVSGIQMIGFAFVMLGSVMKKYAGHIIPTAVFDFVESKRFMIGIFLYLGVSQIQSLLTNTGAFEVYAFNRDSESLSDSSYELIYSGLSNSGIVPKAQTIIQSLTDLGIIDDN